MEQHDLIKSGEMVLQLSLKRGTKGVVITAKIHSVIEDFFRTSGLGGFIPANYSGRYWTSVGEGRLPGLWDVSPNLNGPHSFEGGVYRLDCPGTALIVDGSNPRTGAPAEVINLSFLRFEGISEAGIEFVCKTVMTPEALKSLGNQLRAAVKRFYQDFLKPLEVIITMTTEVRQ